ncbi:hypothetical protein BC827DRAFT_829248 [Russula dissimulans]|nr:hypothetical protein BC827DRAFT_829248 [Russula dissimulans]
MQAAAAVNKSSDKLPLQCQGCTRRVWRRKNGRSRGGSSKRLYLRWKSREWACGQRGDSNETLLPPLRHGVGPPKITVYDGFLLRGETHYYSRVIPYLPHITAHDRKFSNRLDNVFQVNTDMQTTRRSRGGRERKSGIREAVSVYEVHRHSGHGVRECRRCGCR